MRDRDVPDDRQAESGASACAGAAVVDAVEALEDAFLLLRLDPDPVVGDADLDVLVGVPVDRRDRDGDAGALVRVVDGVLHQVGHGVGELPPVAEHERLRCACEDQADLPLCRALPGPGDGLGDDVVDVGDLAREHRVFGLQPGQVDDLVDQLGKARRLDLKLCREPPNCLRVVVGGLDGLGEHADRPDGRLQFVGDVGDEVAAHGVDASLGGLVLGKDEHALTVERSKPDLEFDGLVAGQLLPQDGPAVAVTGCPDLTHAFQQLREPEPIAARQVQHGGLLVRAEDLVVGAHHHCAGGDQCEHVAQLARHRLRVAARLELAPAFAPAVHEVEEQASQERHSGADQSGKGWVHAAIIGCRSGPTPPLRPPPNGCPKASPLVHRRLTRSQRGCTSVP
nr:hypothetical protein [Tessaracoccus aquimaris]